MFLIKVELEVTLIYNLTGYLQVVLEVQLIREVLLVLLVLVGHRVLEVLEDLVVLLVHHLRLGRSLLKYLFLLPYQWLLFLHFLLCLLLILCIQRPHGFLGVLVHLGVLLVR